MAYPKLLRRLFENEGAGPKINADLLPAMNYLPTAGGTMTGSINLGAKGAKLRTSTDGAFIIGNNANADMPNIWFSNGSTGARLQWTAGSGFGLSNPLTVDGSIKNYNGWTGTACIGEKGSAYQYVYTRAINLVNQNGEVTGDIWSDATDGQFNIGPFTNGAGTVGFDTRRFGSLYVVNGFATTFRSTSDIRKKENIEPRSFELSSLGTYSYNFKEDKAKTRHVGLIAQEVEKVIPEAVSETGDGTKVLDYNAVVAALVSEVNALKQEIRELKHGK